MKRTPAGSCVHWFGMYKTHEPESNTLRRRRRVYTQEHKESSQSEYEMHSAKYSEEAWNIALEARNWSAGAPPKIEQQSQEQVFAWPW